MMNLFMPGRHEPRLPDGEVRLQEEKRQYLYH